MMRPADVMAGLARAKAHGLSTRLVTNGFWARSEAAASDMVTRLAEAGLDELNLSTGDEHVRWVPPEAVIRGAKHGLAAGLTTAIMVEMRKGGSLTKAAIKAHPEYRAAVDALGGLEPRIVESPWMPVDPDRSGDYDAGVAVTSDTVCSSAGCESVLTTITLLADGTYAACCGLGVRELPDLHIGHVETQSLAQVEKSARDDLLKSWIQVEGPFAILDWAARHDPDIEWSGRYAHKCQACLRLYRDPKVRQVILDRYEEKLADIVFSKLVLFEKPRPAKDLAPPDLSTANS